MWGTSEQAGTKGLERKFAYVRGLKALLGYCDSVLPFAFSR